MNIANISVKQPIFITCIAIAMMTFGAFCFMKMPVDYYPDSNIPRVSVTTVYAGAGPNDMETLVTKPLEDSISNASGIKTITSKSMEGVSLVMAEFNQDVDAKYAEQLVRDKVNQARAKLPQDTKEPIISRLDLSALPILIVGLSADMTDAKLYDLADQVIKTRLEQVDKIGSVEIIGGRKQEIQVLLDQNKLKRKEMSILQVAERVGAAGQNIPIGTVNQGQTEFSFRAMGDFKSMKDIADTLVGLYGNESPTRVSDIGTVFDTVEDEKSRMRIDGKSALMFQIYRQSGSNTVNVAEAVKKQIAALQTEIASLPGHPKLITIIDSSAVIKNEVNDVYLTIVLGILLTVVTVFFFLGNVRSTLITGMALPLSLVGVCSLLYLASCTVNIITLMAMSLAVGLLIDDAIVVIENIYRRIDSGEKLRDAVINGTGEIQLSVTAISLVVISVFLPMAFMQGTVGQMLRQFGLAVTFSMAISLFVALTIVPMLTAYLADGKGNASLSKVQDKTVRVRWFSHPLAAFGHFQMWLSERYERLLTLVLKYSRTVLIFSAAIFLVCTASFFKISKNFVPDDDNGVLTVDLECAPGTNIDGVQKALNEVERIAKQHPDVGMSFLQGGSRNSESNKGSV
jgi:HAE1 family hydrophobic/amphiphilic exporter-1